LAEAHLKLHMLDELINQANKHFKTDLKKSFGMTQLRPAVHDPTGSVSRRFAKSSGEQGTRTTSTQSESARKRTKKR
jgi:hypothetical protein